MSSAITLNDPAFRYEQQLRAARQSNQNMFSNMGQKTAQFMQGQLFPRSALLVVHY